MQPDAVQKYHRLRLLVLSDNREKKNETLDNYYYLKDPSKNNIETLLHENKN